jgi:hypothetical protein
LLFHSMIKQSPSSPSPPPTKPLTPEWEREHLTKKHQNQLNNQTVSAAATTNQQQPRPTVMPCTCNEPIIRLRKYIEARQQSADFLPFNRGLTITQQKTINRRYNKNITTTAVMTTTMFTDQRSLFIDHRPSALDEQTERTMEEEARLQMDERARRINWNFQNKNRARTPPLASKIFWVLELVEWVDDGRNNLEPPKSFGTPKIIWDPRVDSTSGPGWVNQRSKSIGST